MRTSRVVQVGMVLLLTVMVSLNLRILLMAHENQGKDDLDYGEITNCEVVIRTSAEVKSFNISKTWYDWLNLKPNQSKVLGHRRPQKGFLTIGIPSVKRENGMTYLLKTLTSLANSCTAAEKREIVIVVFLADFDKKYNKEAAANLTANFMDYIHMGFIQTSLRQLIVRYERAVGKEPATNKQRISVSGEVRFAIVATEPWASYINSQGKEAASMRFVACDGATHAVGYAYNLSRPDDICYGLSVRVQATMRNGCLRIPTSAKVYRIPRIKLSDEQKSEAALALIRETTSIVVIKQEDQDTEVTVTGKVIAVVQATRDFYPPLQRLKANFDDAPERVQWRAKQVADFCFLFLYSEELSTYYVQLEDDVTAAPNYFSAIRDFLSYQRSHWAMVEFSELGFIGKLVRSSDLKKLARYMMTFYDEQPVDWLLRYYRLSMAQNKQILRKPTLFQHEGLTSSFDTSKQNRLRDRYFDTGEKHYKGHDPPANLYTSLVPHETYSADLAYGSGSGYFWAHSPVQGDAYTIVFEQSARLQRVAVVTGCEQHPDDYLRHGVLEASPKMLRTTPNGAICADWRGLGTLQGGKLDATGLDEVLRGRTTQCLRLSVTQNQTEWLVIQQVAVFLQGKP